MNAIEFVYFVTVINLQETTITLIQLLKSLSRKQILNAHANRQLLPLHSMTSLSIPDDFFK